MIHMILVFVVQTHFNLQKTRIVIGTFVLYDQCDSRMFTFDHHRLCNPFGSPLGWPSGWRYIVTTRESQRRTGTIRDGGALDNQETSWCSPQCVWGPRDAAGRQTLPLRLCAAPVRRGMRFCPAVSVSEWACLFWHQEEENIGYWLLSAGGSTRGGREPWQALSWRPLPRRSTQTSRLRCRKPQSPPGSTLSGPWALSGAMPAKGSCLRSTPKSHVSGCSSHARMHLQNNMMLQAQGA